MKKNYNKLYFKENEKENEKEKEKENENSSEVWSKTGEEITIIDLDSPPPPPEPKTAFVTNCQRLNIRQKPSKEAEIICIVNAGDTLLVESVLEDWLHVYTPSGIEGYTMKSFVTW